jgi:hypothetical protein
MTKDHTIAFCLIGQNSVSQREIQRCFNLIEFFWQRKSNVELDYDNQPEPKRCITLALALIYYFRLPTNEDNSQRNDNKTPPREELATVLSSVIPDFVDIIQYELENFVNTDNFVIPHGVAINQAVGFLYIYIYSIRTKVTDSHLSKIREHIFSIVVSIVTRTPLCIIGAPGKFHILRLNFIVRMSFDKLTLYIAHTHLLI